MDIRVNTVNFTADGKLMDFVHEKVRKLELIYGNIITGEVYLRLDKNNSNDNKIAEVKLLLPGSELFAKKKCNSFEEATDLAVQALKKQVAKRKKKVA